MRYLVLVSHGTLAEGMHSVLKMLGGDSPAVRHCCLEDGMGAEAFIENFKKTIEDMNAEDEIVLMGDIQGGSPLTNAMNEIASAGYAAFDHRLCRHEPTHGDDRIHELGRRRPGRS